MCALYGEVYGSWSVYDEVLSGGAESESAHVKLETGCVDVERTCVEMETGYVDVEMANDHVEIEKGCLKMRRRVDYSLLLAEQPPR